jgi:hypothetical protein
VHDLTSNFAVMFHFKSISTPILTLTLNRMAGGIYDSLNFEQKQIKMPEVKIFFLLDLLLTKYVIIITCLRFLQNTVLGDFSIKNSVP